MMTTDIAIVGAGPAGIAAATEAARAGASVLVLDEYVQAGGQYYRRPGPGLAASPRAKLFERSREGQALVEQAQRAGVTFRPETLVWGGFADGTLALHTGSRSEVLRPEKMILATGATERPIAFPGWTLPGVMTAGAAQALLKGQGILPGQRILMAGTGPLQVAVAAQLVEAGANLVGVLEAGKFGSLFSSGTRFWGQWGRLGEGIQYYRALRSAKVPVTFGRTVVRAQGDGVLSRVVTADLDSEWNPIPGTEVSLEVDTLCLGFGLIPSTRLARVLGCQMVYDPARGGHVPVLDDSLQTSRPGVFVAGEAAGIGGARVAELQGRLAGMAAARQLGKGNPSEAKKQIEAVRKELKKELGFARNLNETFALRPGILNLLTDDTILCRCEEVTVGELRRDRPDWFYNLTAARTVARVGMGNCQGATCETLVAQLLAREAGKEVAAMGTYHLRPPLKPIAIAELAELSARLPQTGHAE